MTDEERAALDIQLDAYLHGLLTPAQTRETERMLIDPDVAAVLAEVIAFREVLATMPSDNPPEGLIDSIFEALGVEDPLPVKRGEMTRRLAALDGARGAMEGAAWAVRGPRTAASSMRYALGPLARRKNEEAQAKPKTSLLRRAWSLRGVFGRRDVQ